eukprot:CAMPEP_0203879732 /NCGR_PEP_ID=MMETSP0359-20131031/24170_1 /ASSEMBLY_ACC=CAM_ASM_000338 /TAXON_ID=268821 /ORGANISM="Scrippsiella Hangoei, Strain SHTV-5" /LENGTH=56 /DNA_ID=CAMNT_0050799211 /DNA_START=1 /DNA_END=168 /DNA_ORIENTATION=+
MALTHVLETEQASACELPCSNSRWNMRQLSTSKFLCDALDFGARILEGSMLDPAPD